MRIGGVGRVGGVGGGRALAAVAASAAYAAGATRLVVVGPAMPELLTEVPARGGRELEFTREDPPGSGPIPALRAGIERVSEPWVLLLAADLPFLTARHLGELVAGAGEGAEVGVGAGESAAERGAVLIDDQGRPQWLSSFWPAGVLRAGLARYADASLRGLLGVLPHALVAATIEPGQPPYWLDCDTPADLEAAQRWAAVQSPWLLSGGCRGAD